MKLKGGILIATVMSLVAVFSLSAADNVVKVGVLLPLSGSSASMGQQSKNGIEIAINAINDQGGIKSLNGAKLVPVYADSTGSPDVGSTEIEKLIVRDKVNVILGPYNSNVGAATAPVAEKYQIPYMLTNCVADSILTQNYKYVFRSNQCSSGNAYDLIAFLKDVGTKTGNAIKNIALVYEDGEWGTSSAQALQSVAKAAGINVVASISYPSNTVDMTSLIVKLKSANPQVVIPMSYLNDALLFINTAAELKLNSVVLAGGGGFSDPTFVEKAGKVANGVITLTGWTTDILSSKPVAAKKLNDEFKSKYGMDFSEYSANAWLSAMVMFDAVERAASLKPAEIQKALYNTKLTDSDKPLLLHAYNGVVFNQELRGMKNQNIYAHQVIVQIQDGKYRMVWPFNGAPKDVKLIWSEPK